MPFHGIRGAALSLVFGAFVGACSPGATSGPSLAASVPPSTAAAASPVAGSPRHRLTPAPAPSGVTPLPTEFAAALEPGTYWSAPPFDIGFSFEVDQPGWIAGHLNGEFFDIQRDADGAGPELPQRLLGFAHPLEIHGMSIVEASQLTPDEAVDLWVDRSDIETANVTDMELLGGAAVRVDLHAPLPMLALFGGDDGTFRVDTDFDVRIIVVGLDDGLFLVTIHAPAAELEAAWSEALPILESIDMRT